jgi:hypothetical protein
VNTKINEIAQQEKFLTLKYEGLPVQKGMGPKP